MICPFLVQILILFINQKKTQITHHTIFKIFFNINTALHLAIKNNDLKIVKLLLSRKEIKVNEISIFIYCINQISLRFEIQFKHIICFK